ncbi:MAG: transposase [Deltaproteobacteria bacterium]|nr:transposase [Deltaproteobacteria bacterium]
MGNRSDAARLAELEREKAALTERLHDTEASLERLRRAYTHALAQLQLMRRRSSVASAERAAVDAAQLAFDALFAEVQSLSKELDAAAGDEDGDDEGEKTKRKRKTPPTGRRDLAETDLPVVRVELTDPELEGKAERIGFEESSRLGYERGGARRIVVARAVYKVAEPAVEAAVEPIADAPAESSPVTETPRIVTTPLPRELFRRALLAPSMIAHVLVSKYLLGVPFYHLEQSFALQGFSLDRGTMSRYAEDVGATLGAIVEAARDEAMRTAFCLSTDATGVRIQPGPLQERQRGPCRKGHFFVVLADRDHIFFEYQERHTSAAVCSMFKGYSPLTCRPTLTPSTTPSSPGRPPVEGRPIPSRTRRPGGRLLEPLPPRILGGRRLQADDRRRGPAPHRRHLRRRPRARRPAAGDPQAPSRGARAAARGRLLRLGRGGGCRAPPAGLRDVRARLRAQPGRAVAALPGRRPLATGEQRVGAGAASRRRRPQVCAAPRYAEHLAIAGVCAAEALRGLGIFTALRGRRAGRRSG